MKFQRFQDFTVSGFQGFAVSMFQGFAVSMFQGFAVSGFQGFAVSGFQGFAVSGISGLGRFIGVVGLKDWVLFQQFLVIAIALLKHFLKIVNF